QPQAMPLLIGGEPSTVGERVGPHHAGKIALVARIEPTRYLDLAIEDLVCQPPRGRGPQQLYVNRVEMRSVDVRAGPVIDPGTFAGEEIGHALQDVLHLAVYRTIGIVQHHRDPIVGQSIASRWR